MKYTSGLGIVVLWDDEIRKDKSGTYKIHIWFWCVLTYVLAHNTIIYHKKRMIVVITHSSHYRKSSLYFHVKR